MKKIRNDYENEKPEFSKKQIERIDEIENAVYDVCKVMTREDLKWDYNIIGDVADSIAEILTSKGMTIYYPAIVEDENGNRRIIDYYSDFIKI